MTVKTTKIFISHSKKDREIALKLIERLREHEIEVWFDEFEIKIGDNFLDKIYSGLNECKYLAIILTNNSVNSSFVKEELSYAKLNELKNLDIKILPLLFEQCPIPDPIKLLQYGNFTDFNIGFNQLLHFFGKINIKESILKEPNTQILSHKPKIIIGLGTTGVVTAAQIRDKLDIITRNNLFRFIVFDTYADIGQAQNFSDTEFVAGILNLNDSSIEDEGIKQYIKETNFNFVTLGSCGNRAIGRLAFKYHIDRFKNIFNVSFFELSRNKFLPSIHIIATLTGGTGSGSLIDCAELIRKSCFPANIEIYGHLGILIDHPLFNIYKKNYNESQIEIKCSTKVEFQKELFSPLINENKY